MQGGLASDAGKVGCKGGHSDAKKVGGRRGVARYAEYVGRKLGVAIDAG